MDTLLAVPLTPLLGAPVIAATRSGQGIDQIGRDVRDRGTTALDAVEVWQVMDTTATRAPSDQEIFTRLPWFTGALGLRLPVSDQRSFARHSRQPDVSAGGGCNKTRVRAYVTHTLVRDTFLGVRIGYGRVSTRDQHPEAQADALSAAGCERMFIDTASGKLARRPELDEALRMLRAGDQLVVTKLDRLGRSLEHLIDPVQPAAG